VIAGSVLEGHLRKLAVKHGIAAEKADGAPKKADTLNADLAREAVYTKLVRKSITAWLALRNSAAHGQDGDYDRFESPCRLKRKALPLRGFPRF
jgi:hypothetical protein